MGSPRDPRPGEGLPQHPGRMSTCGGTEPKAPEGTWWKHKASPEPGRVQTSTPGGEILGLSGGAAPPSCQRAPWPLPRLCPGPWLIPEPLQGSKTVHDKQVTAEFCVLLAMGLQQPTNPGESARKHTATAAGPSRLEPPAKTHPVTC